MVAALRNSEVCPAFEQECILHFVSIAQHWQWYSLTSSTPRRYCYSQRSPLCPRRWLRYLVTGNAVCNRKLHSILDLNNTHHRPWCHWSYGSLKRARHGNPSARSGKPGEHRDLSHLRCKSATLLFFLHTIAKTLTQQICSNETQSIGKYVGVPSGDLRDVQLLCGPAFRSFTAGCEAATCSPAEYQTTQLLAQQLCGSLYNNNATLSSSVSAAIASATAEAKAATEGKDPTNLANFPPCAVRLYHSSFPLIGPTYPFVVPTHLSYLPIYPTHLFILHTHRYAQRLSAKLRSLSCVAKMHSTKTTITAAEAPPTWSACARGSNSIMPSILARRLVVVLQIWSVRALFASRMKLDR